MATVTLSQCNLSPLCIYFCKVVLIGVPGAFTPTCSLKHLPGFLEKADELKSKGVDTIACVAVNDAFVMDAWSKSVGTDDKIMMLADGSADFTKVIDLPDIEGISFSLRLLPQRVIGIPGMPRGYACIGRVCLMFSLPRPIFVFSSSKSAWCGKSCLVLGRPLMWHA